MANVEQEDLPEEPEKLPDEEPEEAPTEPPEPPDLEE